MSSPRSLFIQLLERDAVPASKIAEALAVTGVSPSGPAWKGFIDRLLLWLGGLALAFAVMFFVAYNWNEFGRFAKFGMVEAAVATAVIAYWKFGDASIAGKVSLLVATILLGVLLALFGQTYQTGADPWQLFFVWSLLMLPWAIVGRFAAIWIVWIALINLSIVLYYQTFGGIFWMMTGPDTGMFWLTFVINTLMLAAWELLSGRWRWLVERWAIRLLAVASGVSVTALALLAIFEGDVGAAAAVVWVAWLAGMYWIYRRTRPDLFMLAGCCLSGIVVLVALLSKHVLDHADAGGYLFISLVVIGLGAGSAFWLKRVHQEQHS